MEHEPEPLTIPEDRPTLYPIRYPDVWKLRKNIESLNWTAQDVDLSTDREDWKNKLSPGEREFYKYIFGMFGPADEKVMRNIGERFMEEFECKEVVSFYRFQAAQEDVHSEAYSLQIETLFDDEEEKTKVFNAVLNLPVIGKMMKWVDAWIGSSESLGTRVAAFSVFEGVMFQSQFMAIQLLKERNIMSGVTTYNEYISRDENIHCSFACYLLQNYIRNRPSEERVHTIIMEAVSLCDEFISEALAAAKKAEGLPEKAASPVLYVTEDKMRQYIRSVADLVAAEMGYSGVVYGVDNPYPEATKLSLNAVTKSNFFEHRPTQYRRGDIDYQLAPEADRCRSLAPLLVS